LAGATAAAGFNHETLIAALEIRAEAIRRHVL
jgi:hypothetical protein